MAFFSRARRMFSYGDLNGSVSDSRDIHGSTSVHIDDPNGGIMSANEKYRRRKRKIIIGVAVLAVVIVAILAISSKQKDIVTSAIKRLPKSFSSASGTQHHPMRVDDENRVSFDDFLHGKFLPRNFPDFNGTWISDNEFLYEHFHALKLFDVSSQRSNTIMSSSLMDHYHVFDYALSADRMYLMAQVNYSRVYRRSYTAEYIIFELKDGRVSNQQKTLKPQGHPDKEPYRIRHASFAPKGNGVVYVDMDNNIFVRSEAMGIDEKITESGVEGKVFNGIPDWVFEEEIFEESKAVWWSPDGKKLVWGVFDDTDVEIYLLQSYGTLSHVEQYPLYKDLAYPKVGTPNPTVELKMCNFNGGSCERRSVLPPKSLKGEEVHFSRVHFIDDNHFIVQWLNRVQNVTVISMCQTDGLDECQEIFVNAESEGWIEYTYEVLFDPAWTQDKGPAPDFVIILSNPTTRHRYRQVVLISAGKQTFLTTRDADVTKILKWSTDGFIYFTAVAEGLPGSQHLYRIPSPNLDVQAIVTECMTCSFNLSDALHQRPCQRFTASFSEGGSHFFMNCAGPGIPYSCLHRTSDNEMLMVYEDNSGVEKRMKDKEIPDIQHMEIPISGSELKAQAKMYLPAGFDPERRYPMLVYIYGGPGAQHVDLSFNHYEFQTYLAGNKEFIYTIIDPMGTAGQGDKWRYSMYRQFGTVEVSTIIDATQYLMEDLSYLDTDRIAIWGWSYGGFLSLSTLASDKNDQIFKCGISVAPVADWSLYDTYYTERYMGLLSDNVQGYNQSRVFGKLDNLKDKPFYLIHGTDDDNVHYQQSLLLSQALEEKDVLFRQQSYTDQDHSIGDYRRHLYHSITDFLLNDCFRETNPVYRKR